MSDDADEKDAVGFGRPPKSGQFQKGRSGNPRGRRAKKNSKFGDGLHPSVLDDVIDELSQPLVVRENGREKKISKQRAFVVALINSAIKGDVRAINAVVALAKNFGPSSADDDISPNEDSVDDLEDLEILEVFVARERARRARQADVSKAETTDADRDDRNNDGQSTNSEGNSE
jgi:hypothetical protein